MKKNLFLVVSIVFSAMLTSVFLPACTSANEQALAKMHAPQHDYLQSKLMKVQYGMSERAVDEILGLPREGQGSPRPCYDAPKYESDNDGKGVVCVRFVLYKATEIEWTQGRGEKSFVYRMDLEKIAQEAAKK